MFDVFRNLATDDAKEKDGVWRDIGDGARLLIARAGNRKYARALGVAVEANQRVLDLKNDAADDMSDSIMATVIAQTILLGWEGVGFKGEPLPYSVENARELLKVKDFRALVSRLSNDFEAYRAAQEAEQAKN